mgnify:CR=1 FL=1
MRLNLFIFVDSIVVIGIFNVVHLVLLESTFIVLGFGRLFAYAVGDEVIVGIIKIMSSGSLWV